MRSLELLTKPQSEGRVLAKTESYFKVLATMGTSTDPGIEHLKTDLLVLGLITLSRQTGLLRRLDQSLSGLISEEINKAHFYPTAGESLLISMPPGAAARHLLLTGLGNYRRFTGKVVCNLLGNVLTTAREVGAMSVCIPIPPRRLTALSLSLSATAAVMRCRLNQFMLTQPEIPVPEIVFYCTPSAGVHLRSGLTIAPWRCLPCPLNDVDPENVGSLDILDS